MGTRSQEQYALLTDYDTDTAYSEAFHTLFANIRLNWENTSNKPHTLLFTTPTASSEQAAVVANVAIVAAQSGVPTILVDADLRNPGLQQRFGLSKSPGLSDLLTEEAIPAQKVALYLQTTFIPGLRLLGAGTLAAQGAKDKEDYGVVKPYSYNLYRLEEVLCSICQFLEETETQLCAVLFHSPPVLVGADASLISALVDQTFLTIVSERTTRAEAKQAQEQLQRVHAKLAGIIMLDA